MNRYEFISSLQKF